MLIFIIDDEEIVREETRQTVQEAEPESEIVTFKNAMEALDSIKSGQVPEVVFSDIEMPGLTGLEFAVKLKSISPSTRVTYCPHSSHINNPLCADTLPPR